MGAVLAKFRKQKTTEEVLETLDEKIHQIEKYSLNTQEQKKRFVGNFLAISIGIYVIAFIVFYFVYFPPTWRERIIYSVPLLLFPLVIILLRKLLTWYFQRKLNKNSNELTELRAEKKKILEQVMDKETYKVAVNLLARFGEKSNGSKLPHAMTPRLPSSVRHSSTAIQPLNQSTLSSASNISSVGGQLQLPSNLRQLSAMTNTPRALPQMRMAPSVGGYGRTPSPPGAVQSLALTPQVRYGQELRRRTPFPIVNQQNKGVLERIVDVLIGDGPQDRFAMICKQCFGHNGMALKEDFDYTTFRCAFCNALNPARLERPVAPRLPEQHLTPRAITANDSSDSSTIEDDDSDLEQERQPKRLSHEVPTVELTESNEDIAAASELPAESAASEVPAPAVADIIEDLLAKRRSDSETEESAKLLEHEQHEELPAEKVVGVEGQSKSQLDGVEPSNLLDEFKKEM